jgi:hypothetical protein
MWERDGVWVKALFDGHALDLQFFSFKMSMVVNNKIIMKKDFPMNLIIQLWAKLNSFAILKNKFSKFIKIFEITCVQVIGFVEDEC